LLYQPRNDAIGRDMADTKVLSQVDEPTLRVSVDQLGNRFNIILGSLRRMVFAGSLIPSWLGRWLGHVEIEGLIGTNLLGYLTLLGESHREINR